MILACDFGKKRIGVALAEPESGIVVWTSTVEHSRRVFEGIRQIVLDSGVLKIIVGLPLNLKCSFTESTDAAVMFASFLFDRVCRAVYLVDERFTTASVYVYGKQLGKSVAESRLRVDAGSAACILDTYLKNPRAALPFSRKTMSEEVVAKVIEEQAKESDEGGDPLQVTVTGLSRFLLFSDTGRHWALNERNPWHFSRYRTVKKPDAIVSYSFYFGQ